MAIHIQNQDKVQQKIGQIKEQGKKSFHIICDFDKTLTKALINGRKIHSTYAVIRENNYLGEKFTKEEYALFEKYHPYEVDLNVDMPTKIKLMQEWWQKHWDLMLKAKMKRQVIEDVIVKKQMQFRSGADEFFRILEGKQVPLLIFSAGMGSVIKLFLEDENKLTSNVHLVSNFLEFDEQGIAIDYSKPLIHTFNKNEYAIRHTPYYNEVKEKKNVILLGDSLGDVNMDEGMAHDVVLKIGFLNGRDKLLEIYKEQFDVVIDEEGMEWVNELLIRLTTF